MLMMQRCTSAGFASCHNSSAASSASRSMRQSCTCHASSSSTTTTTQINPGTRTSSGSRERQCRRRDTLLTAASLLLGTMQHPLHADASVPDLSVPPFSLPQPPEPVRFPRKALSLRFAVLLMRSSFDAVDKLDFVSMDMFQKNFWLGRQSQLEAYRLAYAPLTMRNGDLTDPLYFDFISCAQYATISNELGRPQRSFQEYVEVCPPGAGDDDPCDGSTQLVTRPAQFADDAKLASYFYEVAGDLMLQRLRDGFQGWQSGAPPPPAQGASLQELVAGVQQLLDAMLGGGYALSATASSSSSSSASDSSPHGSFSVTVVGPCSLWSVGTLRARNARVLNVYDACVIDAWLRAGGRVVRSCEIMQTASGWQELWAVDEA